MLFTTLERRNGRFLITYLLNEALRHREVSTDRSLSLLTRHRIGQLQKKFEEWSLTRNSDTKGKSLSKTVNAGSDLNSIDPALLEASSQVFDSIPYAEKAFHKKPFKKPKSLSCENGQVDGFAVLTDLDFTAECFDFEYSTQETKLHLSSGDQRINSTCRSAISSLMFTSDFVKSYIADHRESNLQEELRVEVQHDPANNSKSAIGHAISAGLSDGSLLRAAFSFRDAGQNSEALELTLLHICLAILQDELGLRSLCQGLLRCVLLDYRGQYRQLIRTAIACTEGELPADLRLSFSSITKIMLGDMKILDWERNSSDPTKVRARLWHISSILALPDDMVAEIACWLASSTGEFTLGSESTTSVYRLNGLRPIFDILFQKNYT